MSSQSAIPSGSDSRAWSVELKRATAADAARAFGFFARLQAEEGVPDSLCLDEAGFRRIWLEELKTGIVFAERSEQTVGFCGWVCDRFIPGFEDALYMSAVYAEPGSRRLGLGRRFVAYLLRQARSLGRSRLVWCVQADNLSALLFSRALGAKDVGERLIQTGGVTVGLRLFALSSDAFS